MRIWIWIWVVAFCLSDDENGAIWCVRWTATVEHPPQLRVDERLRAGRG
jgi:hypothetical protein